MCVPHTCNDSNIICRLFRKFRFIGLYYYLSNGLQQWAFVYLIFGLFVPIAVNIAIALAQQVDTRVLIIDCDLRRPRIQSVLEIPVDKGITNYLNFECEVSDIVYTSKLDNLDAICCGTIPPNPSELLSSDNMKELIKELSKQYDYIIFDTPPIGVVIDALPIIKQTDGVVVIVRDNVTDIRDYKKTIDILKRSEANIIGVIFNDVEPVGKRKYGGGYKYGYYGEYGY